MNATRVTCSESTIQRFLEGRLPDAEQLSFEQHLEQCSVCDRRLASISASQDFWIETHRFLGDTRELPDLQSKTFSLDWSSTEDWSNRNAFCEIKLDPSDDPRMLGRIGEYEINSVIGRGGMGVVLRAWDPTLGRTIALKILNPTYAYQPAARQRFAREAKAAAAVVHDNVMPIYGVDSFNGAPYLVMPFVEGKSLQQRIDRDDPLQIDELLNISLQLARGLQAAHAQGVIHRDIKPLNILLPQNGSRVLITDFGLARVAADATLTRSGVIAGTPAYMSPEQARGAGLDPRSDLFSLGCVMFAMATGRPPFCDESAYVVLRRIVDEQPRPLREINSLIPKWFEAIVNKLLAKNREDRFESAEQLGGHLEACIAHLREPNKVSLPQLKRNNRSMSRLWIGIISFCLLVVAVSTFIYRTQNLERQDSNQSHLLWQPDHTDLGRLEQLLNELNEDLEK